MNVVLLGPPGAGKGTQAKRLEAILRSPHIASGDLFRTLSREGGPLAHEVQRYMNRGEYVPDDLTVKVVLDRLAEPDAQHGVVLDGFPRTVAQASALDEALKDRGSRVDVALFITAPEELLISRVAGRMICPRCNAIYNRATNPARTEGICDNDGQALQRRSDEEVEVVRRRLSTYMIQTLPVVDYYRERHILRDVDGSQPIDVVNSEVDRALARKVAS